MCLLDPAKSPASRRIAGFHVANWGAHGSQTLRESNPPGLLSEIDERFGPHPVGDCDAVDKTQVVCGTFAGGCSMAFSVAERSAGT